MPMTLAEFQTLAEPGLSNIWHDAQEQTEEEFSRIFNVRDQQKATEEDAKLAGFGDLQTIDEGADVTYDEAISPVNKTYDFVEEGLGYKVTKKLDNWELYGQVARFERDLQRAAQNSTEEFAFAVLNNATNTTISAGFDGLSLANTAHTRLDGGPTQQNRPTTLTALSLTSLQDGLTRFNLWTNDRGHPIRSEPQTLVVPPELEITARELVQSTMRPDTANNADNVISGMVEPMVSRYLDSSTFWALVGDRHDLNFFWAERPELSSDTDFDSKTFKRQVRQAYSRGHGEWVGFYLGNT